MSGIDERIELLISRKLDGELTVGQERELTEALSRSYEYRALLADSERIDAVCAQVIGTACEGTSGGALLGHTRVAKQRTNWVLRAGWWAIPSAVAASLALVLFLRPLWLDGSQNSGRGPSVTPPPVVFNGDTARPEAMRVGGFVTHPVAGRRQDKQYYGVFDEEGNLFLIEVGRVRTYRHPGNRGSLRQVGLGM